MTIVICFFTSQCKNTTNKHDKVFYGDIITQLADSLYSVGMIDNDSALANTILTDLLDITYSLPENDYYKADAYRTIAMIYDHWEIIDKALVYYHKAEKICSSINDDHGKLLLAKIWLNMSHLYTVRADYPLAIDFALKGERIFLENNATPYLINAYSKVTSVYERLGQKNQADKYFVKTYQLYSNELDLFSKFTCLNSMGCHYLNNRNADSALYWFNEALQICDSTHYFESQIVAYCNKAKVYTDLYNDNIKSLEQLKLALLSAQKFDNPYEITDVYERIANRFYLLNKPDSCLFYANLCSNLAKKYSYSELYLKATQTKAEVLFQQKDYKQAYALSIENQALREKINFGESRRETMFLSAKFDAERREYEIELLKARDKINEAKLAKRNLFIISILAVLLLIITLSFFITKNVRNRLRLSELQNHLDSQRILTLTQENQIIAQQGLIKGEETERSRIAQNLHDGMGGLLSGIKLKLHNFINDDKFSKTSTHEIESIITLVNQSIIDLRKIAHNIMPEILKSAGLQQAIESFCFSLSEKNTTINLSHFGIPVRFEPGFELAMYRVAQELINNALKHAKASQINVQLIFEAGRLCFMVADNGLGFNKGLPTNKGMGLKSIETRLLSYKGSIDINTYPGKGTEVLIEVNNPPKN